MKQIDYTKAILHAIASPKMIQQDIAALYILVIINSDHTSIPTINQAIMDRWSIPGLQNIKKRAWSYIN